MKNTSLKIIINNSVIAALYFVISLITLPINFGLIQFRIAEALVLLCFFRKDYIFGPVIGCFLVNLTSSLGLFDCLFGTLATLIGCLIIMLSKHLLIGSFCYCLINGITIGFELMFLSGNPNFWINFGFVMLGEVTCICILGYILFMIIGKNKTFLSIIHANQNLDFKW